MGAQPDQRQSDQGRGVIGTDGLQQADAQSLAACRAGAVQDILQGQITVDLGEGQCPEGDIHADGIVDGGESPAAQCQRRMKVHGAPRGRLQLKACTFQGARLADGGDAVQRAHLVRTDDQCIRVARQDGFGLQGRQARGQGGNGLMGQGRLVDIGGHGLEGQAQARKQFLSIGRGGSKDQSHGLL